MEIGFHPKCENHVNPFVAWMLVLNLAMLTGLPLVLLAQEPPSGTYGPPQGYSMPSQGFSGQMPPQGFSVPNMPFGQMPQQGTMPQPDNQGMPPQPSNQGQQPTMGGPPEGQQMGPSEEQIQAMQAKALQQMKSSVGRAEGQLKSVKAKIAKLEKKGLKIPEELTTTLGQADTMFAAVKAAETMDQVEEAGDIGEVMGNVGEMLQKYMPILERMANLPTIFSRVDRQIKTFAKNLATDKALAKRVKIDISASVAKFEEDINKVKASYAAAKEQIAAGEVEDGFDALQSEVFDEFETLGTDHGMIQQLGGLSKALPQIDRDLKNYQRQLDRLKTKGKDTAAAQGILDEGKAKQANLKAAVAAGQQIDVDAIEGMLEDMNDIRGRFVDALNELLGVQAQDTNDLDTGLKMPSVNLPDFSQYGQPNGNQGGAGGGISGNSSM